MELSVNAPAPPPHDCDHALSIDKPATFSPGLQLRKPTDRLYLWKETAYEAVCVSDRDWLSLSSSLAVCKQCVNMQDRQEDTTYCSGSSVAMRYELNRVAYLLSTQKIKQMM